MIVVAGVLLEEAVEKLIAGVPFLTPIASIVTAVLVGSKDCSQCSDTVG
ncbi:hypothetical protein [Hafnia alvei]|uniref:Uncharacterized protein n=1 Tax=Hafnia alvei ATCC 51873 TaxID=1002364 RepID=G9YE46_HAFAL|nr:hypothetical protein [Hafnia alvei]EHM37433.1 hypothetical protein HMPREF0454_04895 [Hafnia alvei ATCC 51873]QQE43310.1 hypothetical protein I6H95_20700 [Hafnia alvei]